MFKPPPEEDWHSDLSGYVVEYWKLSENSSTSVKVQGHTQLLYEIRSVDIYDHDHSCWLGHKTTN